MPIAHLLMALAKWVGVQASLSIHGTVKDCEMVLPEGGQPQDDTQQEHAKGSKTFKVWRAPIWLRELSDKAALQIPLCMGLIERPVAQLRHGRQHGVLTPSSLLAASSLLKAVHPSHDAALYAVADGAEMDQGYLVACATCGRYAAKRLGSLAQQCDHTVKPRGLAQQARRMALGRHPNIRAPMDWRLELVDAATVEAQLPAAEGEELLTIMI
eukprot:6458474-Amphidinium_carterae.1